MSYYHDLYAGPCMPCGAMSQPLHVTLEKMQHAVYHLAPQKVLPPGYAPAALWVTELNEVFKRGPIRIPDAWCCSHLVILPKPGKALKSPADLRPISLLPPCAKLLAFILAQRIRMMLSTSSNLLLSLRTFRTEVSIKHWTGS